MGCCSAQWLLRECFRCKAKPGEWGGKEGGWQGLQEAGGALMPAPPEKVFGLPSEEGLGEEGGTGDRVGYAARRQPRPRVTLGGETPVPNRVLETPGLRMPFHPSKEGLPGCPPQSQHLLPGPQGAVSLLPPGAGRGRRSSRPPGNTLGCGMGASGQSTLPVSTLRMAPGVTSTEN